MEILFYKNNHTFIATYSDGWMSPYASNQSKHCRLPAGT